VFFVINSAPEDVSWKIEIRDWCIVGNTMLAIKISTGGFQWNWATSPKCMYIDAGNVPLYSWIIAITGYIDVPNGFPTGHYYDVWT
jgi:hypothetical protein